MAFIRLNRGNYYLVEGRRDKRTNKVNQRVLFSMGKNLYLPKKILKKYLNDEESLTKLKIATEQKFKSPLKIEEEGTSPQVASIP